MCLLAVTRRTRKFYMWRISRGLLREHHLAVDALWQDRWDLSTASYFLFRKYLSGRETFQSPGSDVFLFIYLFLERLSCHFGFGRKANIWKKCNAASKQMRVKSEKLVLACYSSGLRRQKSGEFGSSSASKKHLQDPFVLSDSFGPQSTKTRS